MTQRVRFLLDECLAAGPVVQAHLRASLELYGATAEFIPFFSKFAPGTEDAVWIGQIATEDDWVVITADRGTHSVSGKKLPDICSTFRVTHVMLSAALAQRSWHYKLLAFAAHWQELLDTANHPKGTGFRLSIAGERSFCLRKVSEPPPEQAPSQKPLF